MRFSTTGLKWSLLIIAIGSSSAALTRVARGQPPAGGRAALLDAHPRCKPSCYHTEQPDPNAGKVQQGCGYMTKSVYEMATHGGWSAPKLSDGAVPRGLVACKFPAVPSAGTWVELSSWARKHVDLAPGDVAFIPADASWESTSINDAPARSVDLYWYRKQMSVEATNQCGSSDNDVCCEASGNPPSRAINVVHSRLDEAKRLQAAGNAASCQQAAKEALAVSRGLQRWNQGYCAKHKTLFDGTITADALKSQVAAMGREADRVFAACGGRDDRTSRDDEDSFHAAW
jgi:hypothetical protein